MTPHSVQTRQLIDRLALVGDVDVVVDASSVCKDEAIGPGWVNLLAVLDAIARHLGGQRPRAILVLDASLLTGTGRKPVAPRERDVLQLVVTECADLAHSNPFLVVDYADDTVLDQALRHDARVVAHDRYREHYRDHSWLKEGGGRFLGWSGVGGTVQISDHGRIGTGIWTDSRVKQEVRLDDLPAHARREVSSWWLRCPNPTCSSHGERLVFGDPGGARWVGHRETFVCSVCRKAAARDGRRPAGRDVYVIWGVDTQVATYLVEDGTSVTVGSGAEADIDVFRAPRAGPALPDRPPDEQRERVDPVHCAIACEHGELTVTDLGSRHGTCVRRMRSAKLADVDMLTPGEPAKLSRGDTAMLAEVIRLRPSGRVLADGLPVSGLPDA